MRNFIFYLSLLLGSLMSFTATAEQDTHTFSDIELAQMLAPIALYPDSLLTHILIASTYPIEIIEAHRWLKKNDNLNKNQSSQLVATFDWDASVQALIPFKRVLRRLSENLSWTQALGDAFLQDESRLLSGIQALRKQARQAGSLKKMDNMDVRYEDNNIIILPREKKVVYVPYYDSRIVYGLWRWTAYPPVHWHAYHRAYVSRHRPFYWNAGVHITFNYFFSAFHWHNRHVVVVAPHRTHYRNYSQRPRRLVAHGGHAKRWSHQPSHRKGVAYRTKKTSARYYSKRVGVHRTKTPLNKNLNTNHRKVKQHSHTVNHSAHSSNRSNHKTNRARHNARGKIKHDKIQTGSVTKQFASHSKPRSTHTHKVKRSHRTSKQVKKQHFSANRHATSSRRKQYQQQRVN